MGNIVADVSLPSSIKKVDLPMSPHSNLQNIFQNYNPRDKSQNYSRSVSTKKQEIISPIMNNQIQSPCVPIQGTRTSISKVKRLSHGFHKTSSLASSKHFLNRKGSQGRPHWNIPLRQPKQSNENKRRSMLEARVSECNSGLITDGQVTIVPNEMTSII